MAASKAKTLSQQIRQKSLDAQRKVSANQRKADAAHKKAEEKRRAASKAKTVDSNGLTPSMRIALARRKKDLDENPAARELVARANARMRVAKLRRDHKLDDVKPAPGYEFGRVIKTEAPTMTVAQRLAEQRADRGESTEVEPVVKPKYVPPSQRKKNRPLSSGKD